MRHAPPAPRVHPGGGVQTTGLGAAHKGRSDSHAAPDGAHQPDGVQQAQGAGVASEACSGGQTATQESQGKDNVMVR